MDTIEIRPNRKYLMPFIGVMILALFFMNYVTFLTDYYEGRSFMWKILSLVLSVSLIASIYKMYRQIKSNAPTLVLSRETFTYYKKGGPVSYYWSEIASWNISTEDSTTYLTIEAHGKKDKIGISWLEKSPDQIDELIRGFK